MNRSDEGRRFERWLDRELPRAVAAELGAAAPTRPNAQPGRRRRVGRLSVAGGAAVVGVVLALASGGAALATGSPNPVTWGRHVVHVVSVGSLTPQRTPAAPSDGHSGRSTAPPSMSDSQGLDDQSNGNQGKSNAKGHDSGGAPSDQNQDPNQGRPAKQHGNQQGASRQQ